MNATATDSDNLTIARRFIDEVLNGGRFELVDELVDHDYRYIGPDGTELVGRQVLAELLGGFRAGFSNLRAEIGTAVAVDRTVAMTVTLTGTHDGEFEGIPPTAAALELPLAIFTTIVDGRIVEDREYYDTGTLLAQLGV